MNEFALIKQYFSPLGNIDRDGHGLRLGIGDDCAVTSLADGEELVFSLDTFVEGVHFPQAAPPRLLAERAMRCALSDLAAMGASPAYFTLALTLPNFDEKWLSQFAEGLAYITNDYGIVLAGGDTTRGPLTISIQVHGTVPEGEALLRSGAEVGDLVCVSGTLGDGAAGLRVVSGEVSLPEAESNYLNQRFYQPDARLELGKSLRNLATSAVDISDGLLADLGHICESSGVGARISEELLPLSLAVSDHFDQAQALEWALTGGDDYELCFTLPSFHRDLLTQLNEVSPVTVIGEIVAGDEIESSKGTDFSKYRAGYAHF